MMQTTSEAADRRHPHDDREAKVLIPPLAAKAAKALRAWLERHGKEE